MKRPQPPTLVGIIGIAGALMVLLGFPVARIEAATPTIKVPGPYPYEETVRIPVPATESPLPSPAPDTWRNPEHESALAGKENVRGSQTGNSRQPLTAKIVRKAAFKYNGVADFCGFLAALPADVGVVDSKLGTTRALVKGGRLVRKNVAWLRKQKQTRRTFASVRKESSREISEFGDET
jgi:hypothetical protein